MECLNPGHPASQAINDSDTQLRFIAILVMKLGGSVMIDSTDVAELGALFSSDSPVLVHSMTDTTLELKLVPRSEAMKLAAMEGGRLN